MLNTVCLMGRLTRDPELKRTQSNTAVCSFALAVERDMKQGDTRPTDFIDVVAWSHTAEFVSKYFSKGQLMAVSGRLQTRTWEDKQGSKRKAVEVVAWDVYFAERKQGGGSASGGVSVDAPEFAEADIDDGCLPF